MGLGNKSNGGRANRLWRGKRRKHWSAVLLSPTPRFLGPVQPGVASASFETNLPIGSAVGASGSMAIGLPLGAPTATGGQQFTSATLISGSSASGPLNNINCGSGAESSGASFLLLSMTVHGIQGKQIAHGADGIATNNLVPGVITANGEGRALFGGGVFDVTTAGIALNAFSIGPSKLLITGQTFDCSTAAVFRVPVTGSNGNDAATKQYVDDIINGLQWKTNVAALNYLGNLSVTGINALTPTAGMAVVVVTTGGTPTAGTSDALAVGDVTEFNGTSWKKIVANVGNFVPAATVLLVAAPNVGFTLSAPLTDGVDEGKAATFSGLSNTPSVYTSIDGEARMISAGAVLVSIYENQIYVFEGVVPTGDWNLINTIVTFGSTVVDVGTSSAGGSSEFYARSDHVHRSPRHTALDKDQTPTATAGNGASTGIPITNVPALGGMPIIVVNNAVYSLGNGSLLTDCYFSGNGGVTARLISAIVAGDILYWNGTIAGFDLTTADRVSFFYEQF